MHGALDAYVHGTTHYAKARLITNCHTPLLSLDERTQSVGKRLLPEAPTVALRGVQAGPSDRLYVNVTNQILTRYRHRGSPRVPSNDTRQSKSFPRPVYRDEPEEDRKDRKRILCVPAGVQRFLSPAILPPQAPDMHDIFIVRHSCVLTYVRPLVEQPPSM